MFCSEPGSFYLPPDPRSEKVRRADALLEERFFGESRQRPNNSNSSNSFGISWNILECCPVASAGVLKEVCVWTRYEEWQAKMEDETLNPDGCRDRAWQVARAVGQDAVDLLVAVEKELVPWLCRTNSSMKAA